MQKQLTIEILTSETINWDDPQITVKIIRRSTQKGFTGIAVGELTEMIIEMAANIGAGIVANFIYERLKQKAVELWIDSKAVEVNKSTIEKAIAETQPDATVQPAQDTPPKAPRQKPENPQELSGDA